MRKLCSPVSKILIIRTDVKVLMSVLPARQDMRILKHKVYAEKEIVRDYKEFFNYRIIIIICDNLRDTFATNWHLILSY